jgi:hypothetical protein
VYTYKGGSLLFLVKNFQIKYLYNNKNKFKLWGKTMKKNCKLQCFLQAVIVIAVAIAFVLPETTVLANRGTQKTEHMMSQNVSDDTMQVENTSGIAGTTEHVIYATGTWSIELAGYELAMYYDASKIEFIDVTLEGTVADYIGTEWNVYWLSNDSVVPGYVVASAVTFGVEDLIPIGSGKLFKLIVNILGEAPEGDTTLDLAQNVGPLPSYCSFSDVYGTVIFPDLIDGILTIVPPLCGDSNGDGAIDVADVMFLINYLFTGTAAPNPLCVGDATGDGIVDSGDVLYIINYLFTGTSGPVDDCCG